MESTKAEPHRIATREEWLTERRTLLRDEKALTRMSDDLARRRRELPWVRIEQPYRFHTENGPATLSDLFAGNSQLLVYHFMMGADYKAGCPSCSAIADGFNGFAIHLQHHDVTLMAVSSAPLDNILAFKRRMGWTFPWASSHGSTFNLDFQVGFTPEQQQSGTIDYNYAPKDIAAWLKLENESFARQRTDSVGTDWVTYLREHPGVSSFILQDRIVYHAYSAYTRGIDALWGMYQWLDRTPLGRNEGADLWWKHHDEY